MVPKLWLMMDFTQDMDVASRTLSLVNSLVLLGQDWYCLKWSHFWRLRMFERRQYMNEAVMEASPQNCIDPLLVAAHIVVRLQMIISREVPPNEPAVLSVCSLHAGSAANVISDRAERLLNVRSMSFGCRDRVLKNAERMIRAECSAVTNLKIRQKMLADDATRRELPFRPNDSTYSSCTNGFQ